MTIDPFALGGRVDPLAAIWAEIEALERQAGTDDDEACKALCERIY
jgi:hypothetical protein